MNGSISKLRLPHLIGDGMVLQRNADVKIWGWADSGEKIQVGIAGRTYESVAGNDGKWAVTLAPMEAGGPYDMSVLAGGGIQAGEQNEAEKHNETGDRNQAGEQIIVQDILFGDVWICSGQSNMQTPISRTVDLYEEEISKARNREIRYFVVPEKYDFHTPQQDLQGGSWVDTNPESVLNFSAVAYFFAAALYEKHHVPIGLINTAIGGIPIETYLSEDALAEFPAHMGELARCRDDSYVDGTTKSEAEASAAWLQRLDREDRGMGGNERSWFHDGVDSSDWSDVTLPASFSEMGLKNFNGSVWFRKEIEISAEFAGAPARIRLGTIVDADTTYVNGTIVGVTTYRYPPRKYNIPTGVLKAGKNIITARIVANSGEGEFIKEKPYRLEIGGQVFSLEGGWKYKVGASLDQPLLQTTFFHDKPAGLFNGMISPLLPFAIKGVVWYQGESNTTRAKEYRLMFPALIRDWREKWNNKCLPFLFVQLHNFNRADEQPSGSEWAELREAQSLALSLPCTAMVVAHDTGEWNDIHPLGKKPIGERLALAARKVVYGEELTYSGPIFSGMEKDGKRIRLFFTNTGKGLVSKDGRPLKHFAVAGADRKFVWAQAEIREQSVVVWNENIEEPVAVRYAWADNPEGANLYNRDGLPASSFRTDDWEAAGRFFRFLPNAK